MRTALITAMFLAGGLIFLPAYGQVYDPALRLYPEVPTDKSNISAIISVTTSTPCYKVEPQGFSLNGTDLQVNVRVIPEPPDTACILVLKEHTIKQEIGMLDAGQYNAWLYVNDERQAGMQISVSPDDVAVLSTGRYEDDQGGINLVGEVQNTGSNPIKLVRVDISFFEGETLEKEEQVYTTMATLMPNRTSGLSLILGDDLADMNYTTSVTSYLVEEEPVEKGLVLEAVAELDDEGYGTVSGRVFNKADHNATQVKIVCAIYSGENMIDSIFGYTDPGTIPAGQDAGFEIATHYRISQEFTASCNAESIELAVEEVQVVPEFPAIAAIAAASVAAALAVDRFRHKL